MKKFIFALFALVLFSTAALAATPTKIGFRSYSGAPAAYLTTCTISGMFSAENRVNVASTRTLSIATKAGFKNYSVAALHPNDSTSTQYQINCVKTGTGEVWQAKMFFDGNETKSFPVSNTVFKPYW